MRRLIACAVLATLAGCGPSSGDGVGGVSATEASALNDAAAMLDARSDAARSTGDGLNPAARTAARADRGRTPAPADIQANSAQ
ncbi:MAG: hypothetical protein ABW039_08680 [Sphingobium sp.]